MYKGTDRYTCWSTYLNHFLVGFGVDDFQHREDIIQMNYIKMFKHSYILDWPQPKLKSWLRTSIKFTYYDWMRQKENKMWTSEEWVEELNPAEHEDLEYTTPWLDRPFVMKIMEHMYSYLSPKQQTAMKEVEAVECGKLRILNSSESAVSARRQARINLRKWLREKHGLDFQDLIKAG